MDSRTESAPPEWAAAYLRFDAWTQDEFRNLLCGLPPVQPDNPPARTRKQVKRTRTQINEIRKQINDDYVRNELRRLDADRHIRDAIVSGHLREHEPPTEALLEKIRAHVAPNDLEMIRHAIAHDRVCAKTYRFPTGPAIAWAVSRRDVFPDFPFTLEDLARVTVAPANTPGNRLQSASRASDPPRGSATGAATPLAFPNRAGWLKRELAERRWSVHDLENHGGPNWKTAKRILAGQDVRETALEKTARALSDGTKRVDLTDVPSN